MHAEPLHFVRQAFGWFDSRGEAVIRVLEVGSQDINGSPRQASPGTVTKWVGIDVFDRPGVDWVGLAHEFPAKGWDGEPFDAIVSCECFEHDPFWRDSLAACVPLLRPGGLVAITVATGDRPPHGQEADTPTPGHYANVSKAELVAHLAALGCVEIAAQVERQNQDLYARAVRGG
jgi:hypothetical protein